MVTSLALATLCLQTREPEPAVPDQACLAGYGITPGEFKQIPPVR
jgi:hypothetical protein